MYRGARSVKKSQKVVIVGGGMFGSCLAIFYQDAGYETVLIEAEGLVSRASYRNQARVHRGYHYPRSFLTASRSAASFARFVCDFSAAIDGRALSVYAVARSGSRVSATQFETFCRRAGAPLWDASARVKTMFDQQFVEGIFEVEETTFDALKIREMLQQRIHERRISVRIGDGVCRVGSLGRGLYVQTRSGAREFADKVIVAAYSGINEILMSSDLPILPLKHEVAEIAIVRHPGELSGMGITVMDGPFFSTIPFPALSAHSLTHVRYTPHASWRDQDGFHPAYQSLASKQWPSNVALMVADARRYVPAIADAVYSQSLFEIKTVLSSNEGNDGRPILFRSDYSGIQGLDIVMGGKIDNVYDVFDALRPQSVVPSGWLDA